VDDVVVALREGELQVRLDADRHAQLGAPRDRDGWTDRDHLGPFPSLERPASREQVGRPRRRCQHGHFVAAPAQGGGDPRDVIVHVVRL